MALAAVYLLGGIESAHLAALGAFDGLAVNDPGSRTELAPCCKAELLMQESMQLHPKAREHPIPIVGVNN